MGNEHGTCNKCRNSKCIHCKEKTLCCSCKEEKRVEKATQRKKDRKIFLYFVKVFFWASTPAFMIGIGMMWSLNRPNFLLAVIGDLLLLCGGVVSVMINLYLYRIDVDNFFWRWTLGKK